MPVDPQSVSWLVCGLGPGDKKGVSVPLTPAVRAAVAAALPDPAPQWPRRAKVVAPSRADRGDGLTRRNVAGGVAVADVLVDGWEQNIVIEHGGAATIDNVVSCNSTPQDVWADVYRGQALYVDDCPSLIVRGYAAVNAGWQPGMPPRAKNAYRHGCYANWGLKSLVIEDAIFWGCSAAGAQCRQWQGSVVLRRPVFVDCGVGLLAVAGNVTLESPTFFGGHCWYQKKADGSPAWTGNMAVSSYTPLTMTDPWIVGTPGQGDSPDGAPAYNLGAVMGSREYGPAAELIRKGELPQAAKPKGATWDVSGGRICGWPTDNRGNLFAGDAPCPQSGWSVSDRPVNPAKLPLGKWLTDLTQSDRPVPDVAAEMRDAIRGAAA